MMKRFTFIYKDHMDTTVKRGEVVNNKKRFYSTMSKTLNGATKKLYQERSVLDVLSVVEG